MLAGLADDELFYSCGEYLLWLERCWTEGDIDRVADIWLKTNLKAHYFISNQYWKSNYELVKEMMPQSEVYVFEVDKMVQGFVGLNDEYIEGIFVSDEM